MSRATLRVRMGVIAASLLTCLGLVATPAIAASHRTTGSSNAAAVSTRNAPSAAARRRARQHARKVAVLHHHSELVQKVLKEAKRQKGKPYVYGAAGPHAFDCSGLVRYVFMHAVHRVLPHNAAAQYHSLRHISRRSLQPGDLVFVDNGGYVSHVGIFDGHHHWWVAPHTGTHVQRQRIYRAHLVFARVLVYDKHLRRRPTHHRHHHNARHHHARHHHARRHHRSRH
jgi:cell wall-associated NlpC family hydrolase